MNCFDICNAAIWRISWKIIWRTSVIFVGPRIPLCTPLPLLLASPLTYAVHLWSVHCKCAMTRNSDRSDRYLSFRIWWFLFSKAIWRISWKIFEKHQSFYGFTEGIMLTVVANFYRPQMKVMFSEMSVCPQAGTWILVCCFGSLRRGRYASYWNAFLVVYYYFLHYSSQLLN